jgi:hypothetical protein
MRNSETGCRHFDAEIAQAIVFTDGRMALTIGCDDCDAEVTSYLTADDVLSAFPTIVLRGDGLDFTGADEDDTEDDAHVS